MIVTTTPGVDGRPVEAHLETVSAVGTAVRLYGR